MLTSTDKRLCMLPMPQLSPENPGMMTRADNKYPYTKNLFFIGAISKPLLLSLSVNQGTCPPMEMPLGRLSSSWSSQVPGDRAKPLPMVWSCHGAQASRAGKVPVIDSLPKACHPPHQKGTRSLHTGLHCIIGRFSARAQKTNEAFICFPALCNRSLR